MASVRLKFHVFVDFDGTIATIDTTDRLLTRFAEPAWLDIEKQWKSGEIGSRECMERQIGLIRATPDELDAFINEIEIDPAFPAFVRFCRKQGFGTTVVSDGIDRTIERVLARAGLNLPFRANHIEWLGSDCWRLGFPYSREACPAAAGHCKCGSLGDAGSVVRIAIGDGRSDFCMAEKADLVLAKGVLAEHCRSTDLRHLPFNDFTEATALLIDWLETAYGSRAGLPKLETEHA